MWDNADDRLSLTALPSKNRLTEYSAAPQDHFPVSPRREPCERFNVPVVGVATGVELRRYLNIPEGRQPGDHPHRSYFAFAASARFNAPTTVSSWRR
jgi:hypothetical protein